MANLQYAKTIVMELGSWRVCVLPETVQIGCQEHTHQSWLDFTDQQIAEMGVKALAWWKQHKPLVAIAIETVSTQPELVRE
jgi:hypothetical protein